MSIFLKYTGLTQTNDWILKIYILETITHVTISGVLVAEWYLRHTANPL